MRNFAFILVLAIGVIGCAKLGEIKKDVNACYSDPVCFAEAVNKATVSSNKASDIAGLSGIPWATKVAKPAVGYAVLLFSLAALGSKKRKSLV